MRKREPSPRTALLQKEISPRKAIIILAACVGAVATCGIVYQLIIGTVSTYLKGNSTFQFSLTIGLSMSAYGLGSFLSTRVKKNLIDWFVLTEILLGLIGGLASFILFQLYARGSAFEVGRFAVIISTGTLIGLEIPILIRIFEDYRQNLRVTVGQLMGFDYLGALVGGISFPLILLPTMGLIGSSFVIGAGNSLIALGTIYAFRHKLKRPRALMIFATIVTMGLIAFSTFTNPIERQIEKELYEDHIVRFHQTKYQRIVVTQHAKDVRMYLDGSLQFSSADEYRYHESLVHPGATRLPNMKKVLILGGGDGLALRELMQYPSIESIELIDLDPGVVDIAKSDLTLSELNKNAFQETPVNVIHDDAFTWVKTRTQTLALRNQYDFIIADLPDPHDASLAKLYSVAFYKNLKKLLKPTGLLVAQIGSPFFGRSTFWTSVKTLETAGWKVRPYHVNVPSFGEWGFALCAQNKIQEPYTTHTGKFHESKTEAALFDFPPDLRPPPGLTPNTMIRPVIVEHFRKDWRKWN